MNDILDKLNPTQREAVTHLGPPLMIIAGAGSGKTRVITHRIAFLHRECGIPINQIMAVTFTNKAAREMRERVCRLLGVPDSPGLPIGTFHSRCAMILRREAAAASLDANFVILDENDQKQAIRRALKDLQIPEKRVRPGMAQSFINNAKMRLLTPTDCETEFDEDEIPYAAIYAKYQEIIEKSKCVDFEDLLMRTVRLFQTDEAVRLRWATRYQYLLVDEYQDTNHAQFLLTQLLARDHEQICVVGDEDQSIYSWRGAEISNLLEFERTFPGTKLVKLEQNYRSTGNILHAASTVIANNTQRIGKTLYTMGDKGDPLRFLAFRDQDEEARSIALECARLITGEGIDPGNIAIFYRGHWLSRAVEDAVRKLRVPYRIVGGMRFYDRAEIKDLLCFLRLAVNPDDDIAFERVVNRPSRGIGAKALGTIVGRAATTGKSLFAACRLLVNGHELKGKAHTGLARFLDAIEHWMVMAENSAPAEILSRILEDTNYKEEGVGDLDSIEADSRLENIEEFEGLMADFKAINTRDQLGEFLTTMALESSEDEQGEGAKVSLMTIHNAKGLEFDYVFTIGLEKNVFPTGRAEESFEEFAIEEERRLFYVALTRARRKFYATYSARRNRPDFFANQPSIFLRELPLEVFDDDSQLRLRRLFPYDFEEEKRTASTNADGWRYEMEAEEGFAPTPRQTSAYGRATRGTMPTGGNSGPGRGRFTVGMRVEHKYMGSGTIAEIGGRPGWERAVVEFDDGRSQEFVLKYAPLSPAR